MESEKKMMQNNSWHLALMTALLSEYAKEKIDVQKTMLMVLIHDIVEIDGPGILMLMMKKEN